MHFSTGSFGCLALLVAGVVAHDGAHHHDSTSTSTTTATHTVTAPLTIVTQTNFEMTGTNTNTIETGILTIQTVIPTYSAIDSASSVTTVVTNSTVGYNATIGGAHTDTHTGTKGGPSSTAGNLTKPSSTAMEPPANTDAATAFTPLGAGAIAAILGAAVAALL